MKKWVVTATILMLLMWTLPLFYWGWGTHKKYFDLLVERADLMIELEDLNEELSNISRVDVGYYTTTGEITVLFGFGGGRISEEYIPLVRLHWYPYPCQNYYNITFELEFIKKDEIVKRLGICSLRLVFYWKVNNTWKNITVLHYMPDQLYTLGGKNIIIPYAEYYAFQSIIKNIEEGSIAIASGVLLNSEEMKDYSNRIEALIDRKNKIEERLDYINYFKDELEIEYRIISLLIVADVFLTIAIGFIGYHLLSRILDHYYSNRKILFVSFVMAAISQLLTPFIILLPPIILAIFIFSIAVVYWICYSSILL